jgi:flavin-dependent dehydrogenase
MPGPVLLAASFPMKLKENDPIVIVGGGPAGAFFAIHYLRLAKSRGLKPDIVIIEKKGRAGRDDALPLLSCREGCNYCAGGLTPKLAEALEEEGISLPEDIVAGRIRSLTIHGHWKNIELRVPEGKKMTAVFRGSRPKGRANQYRNFDSFLLERARESGARIIFGDAYDFRYSEEGRPVVRYHPVSSDERRRLSPEESAGSLVRPRRIQESGQAAEEIEAGFLVLAGGVNQSLGEHVDKNPFWRSVRRVIPGYSPPRVRRALICEVEIQEALESVLEGEIYFIEYGSKSLKIEMSSLIPKGRFITAALLGRSVDESGGRNSLALINEYLELPQLKRIFPPGAEMKPVCLCAPHMAVGAAARVSGERVAAVGDMVWSRLYKDGIYSAYLTSTALARAVLEAGVDSACLRSAYGSVIKNLKHDSVYGRFLFALNRLVFSRPNLSRILYQAVLTERKTRPAGERRLAAILWKIASGDDTYRAGLRAMFHPLAIWSVFAGGFLLTLRNFLTEQMFGLRWYRLGRYPTGLHKEDMEEKREELLRMWRPGFGPAGPAFESLYSITIKSDPEKIFHYLGTFGDEDRRYFRPRWLRVERVRGGRNEPGCLIRYKTPFRFLDFQVVLEHQEKNRHLFFRVRDGFARGGILMFDISRVKKGVFGLSIYVAFDFARGKRRTEKIFWFLFRYFFPGFIHDVLWNHSLCQLKDVIEKDSS